jgi:uncharacterized protein YcbK (DUF882 family)
MYLAILPLQVFVAASLSTATPAPVDVTLYDANHETTYHVQIGLDGSVDAETREQLEYAFRCWRTGKTRKMNKGLLSMIARVAANWPGKPIEYISAYRGHRQQRHESRHFHGRAFDFRMQGVPLTEVRDWVWANFTETGVGWYPEGNFLHMDHRDGHPDIAWTARHHKNRYHPSWSSRVREKRAVKQRIDRTGI